MKTTTVEPAPVFDLDPEKIGAILRLMPAISARVGHKTIQGHLWYGADTSPEHEFVRDAITMPIAEVIEKWYGGQENAQRYAAGLASAVKIPRRLQDDGMS